MRLVTPLALISLSLACTAESSVKIDDAKVEALKAFDYADWTTVLASHVNDAGRVDYPKLKENRLELDRFVALLAAVSPGNRPDLFKTREDRLAYYINAYNAFTMFNVVNRYPDVKSVHDEKVDFFGLTFFKMGDGRTNLNDLENEVVRPRFKEPRAHFAMNCASVGCPVLPTTPFLPATLEAQLAAETEKFLHEPRNVSVEGNKVTLSQIFEWYAVDFQPDVITWINAKAPDLSIPAGAEIAYTPYDWALNDATR